jgi:hypothetical protein
MNHVEIHLTPDQLAVVHDLREIRVFHEGKLSETIKPDGFADLICYSGRSYSFVGVEESASIKGKDVCFLKFYA